MLHYSYMVHSKKHDIICNGCEPYGISQLVVSCRKEFVLKRKPTDFPGSRKKYSSIKHAEIKEENILYAYGRLLSYSRMVDSDLIRW